MITKISVVKFRFLHGCRRLHTRYNNCRTTFESGTATITFAVPLSGNIWHTSGSVNANYDNKHKQWKLNLGSWFSGKSLKSITMLQPAVRFKGKNAPKSISAVAPPVCPDLAGELTALPRPWSWICKESRGRKREKMEWEWAEVRRRGKRKGGERRGRQGAPAWRWYGFPNG